jgi:formylglycine-generating enzyme required for sulfatase activity
MAKLIAETEADGVVLDTRGSSSYELQAAADSVRKGVVMFSEGMAITKDMPGIIAGRVHNAIYYSPELNLNKIIKPDFSIFRVCDVGEDRNHREIAIAFFNGYGTELNMFRPGGRDDGYRNDLDFLARTTFILRQNNDAFLDKDWTPFLPTTTDNAWVNRWRSGDKTIYTVLNMNPQGIRTGLFRIEKEEGRHYVSLWRHENLTPSEVGDTLYLKAVADGYDPAFAGTRLEGSVDCIASFSRLIRAEIRGDSLEVSKPVKGQLLIWKGDPSIKGQRFELRFMSDTIIRIKNIIGYYEGKVVLQYLDNNRLSDECIVTVKGGTPWLISSVTLTKKEQTIPSDMVLVPKNIIKYTLTTREDFMPYPSINKPVTAEVDSFLIDKYPVTNAQFLEFLTSSGYRPADTTGFLRHWEHGSIKQGQEKYPVVYIAFEDIAAYAKWAGKRLPTEAEWQLAAQGTDGRTWPWGNEFHGTWCNNSFERATPVDAFSKGASPYGVLDMVGNVWQMTNDQYFNGTNYFTVIRGGSFYRPESSWWYIQGGPQPLDRTQIMLMVSPGFDRAATVGFRCVKDVVPGSVTIKDRKQK